MATLCGRIAGEMCAEMGGGALQGVAFLARTRGVALFVLDSQAPPPRDDDDDDDDDEEGDDDDEAFRGELSACLVTVPLVPKQDGRAASFPGGGGSGRGTMMAWQPASARGDVLDIGALWSDGRIDALLSVAQALSAACLDVHAGGGGDWTTLRAYRVDVAPSLRGVLKAFAAGHDAQNEAAGACHAATAAAVNTAVRDVAPRGRRRATFPGAWRQLIFLSDPPGGEGACVVAAQRGQTLPRNDTHSLTRPGRRGGPAWVAGRAGIQGVRCR